jgi:uncharacterized membrane protein (TIGR02234 family)
MKSRTVAFGCLIIGGVLALVGSAQPWWRAAGQGVVVTFSGTRATAGLSQALALVALAGTLLLLVLRARGRQVVGALLLLVGAALAVVGGLRPQPGADAVRSRVGEVSLADAFQLAGTAWPWVFAVSGVLVAGGAVLTMITAATWPSASDRFQPGRRQTEGSASDNPAELWRAIDAGLDPTADASVGNRAPPHGGEESAGVLPPRTTTTAGDTSRDARATADKVDHDMAKVPHPDVQDRAAGDTMEGTGRQERGA